MTLQSHGKVTTYPLVGLRRGLLLLLRRQPPPVRVAHLCNLKRDVKATAIVIRIALSITYFQKYNVIEGLKYVNLALGWSVID